MALDIYGLTKRRDLTTINGFLDAVIDRAATEDRGSEELLLDPLGIDSGALGDAESEPAVTLSRIIQRGLVYPRRGFVVYLTTRNQRLERAILRFTADDKLILGLSIDDTGGQAENDARALLEDLFVQHECYIGVILAERAPPTNESDFRALEGRSSTVFFSARA